MQGKEERGWLREGQSWLRGEKCWFRADCDEREPQLCRVLLIGPYIPIEVVLHSSHPSSCLTPNTSRHKRRVCALCVFCVGRVNSAPGEIHELKEELNSLKEDKKKEAVKKVIAFMTVGKDVSMLFADVLKCMQTQNLELKKLVYLYVMNYAKSQPDRAILAVNTFQKVL